MKRPLFLPHIESLIGDCRGIFSCFKWGILLLGLNVCALRLLQSADGSKGPRFTEVFSLTFFGSVVVTLNIKLLGGHM